MITAKSIARYHRLIWALPALASLTACTNWPLEPRDQVHPIGNNGGEFQQYSGGSPYLHEGIDIVDDDPAPTGPYVITRSSGTVSLSLPGVGSLYNGMVLSTSSGSEVYWHLDFNSIEQSVRDAETNGTSLGANQRVSQLVFWTACNYHHLHFEICDSTGQCTEPVLSLNPNTDTNSPSLTDLQFTDNGSETTFTPGFPNTVVSGEVDIIARASDRQFVTATQDHKVGVLKIRYQVVDLATGSVVKTGSTIDFSVIPADSDTTILYRNAAPYDSSSDYCGTETYYYVASNVSDIDPSDYDETYAWDTTAHSNGDYRVEVQVWDHSDNTVTISKQVSISN